MHLPYQNRKAVHLALLALKKEKPNYVVQLGDLYDQYSFSRFTRKNLELPEAELKRGHIDAKDFWNSVKRNAPSAKCFQLLGNHDVRLIKRVQDKLPEAQDLVRRSIMELYRFKGVQTIEDDRDVLKISNVAFHHGYLSKLGDHMRYLGQSTVVGHSHVGGAVFEQRAGRTIWELNAGYLADESEEPLRYRPTKTSKWTLGYGLIEDKGGVLCPQFIPLEV